MSGSAPVCHHPSLELESSGFRSSPRRKRARGLKAETMRWSPRTPLSRDGVVLLLRWQRLRLAKEVKRRSESGRALRAKARDTRLHGAERSATVLSAQCDSTCDIPARPCYLFAACASRGLFPDAPLQFSSATIVTRFFFATPLTSSGRLWRQGRG